MKTMKSIKTLTLLALLGLSTFTQALTPQEIVKKSNEIAVYAGDDGRTEARMMIVDSQKRKQLRQFIILRKNVKKGGEQKYLVVFTRPSDVARTSFLVIKKPASDDDRWLYLPGLDLVKRIGAGDKRTSFVGSTFFYEDISGRNINADTFTLESENDTQWTLKAVPKKASEVEFSHYKVNIDKNTMLPMQAEYFDKQNKLYRRISATKVKQIQGFNTIVQMKAENLIDGSYTITQMRNVRYNEGIDDRIFSERSLRVPPAKWLKFGKK